uniref:Uncharacterized protein n=1 Tax=Rhizophora mucronata TaxID=61149 RepID=A0A2P2JE50_RHIMU
MPRICLKRTLFLLEYRNRKGKRMTYSPIVRQGIYHVSMTNDSTDFASCLLQWPRKTNLRIHPCFQDYGLHSSKTRYLCVYVYIFKYLKS